MFDFYYKYAKKTGLLDLDICIKDYETYEEIHIVNNTGDLSFIKDNIPNTEVQEFLINFSYFYLNLIRIHAQMNLTKQEEEKFFTFLRFDIEDEDDDSAFYPYIVPEILFTRKRFLFASIAKDERLTELDEYPALQKACSNLGLLQSFEFFKSVTKTSYGEWVNIYAILKKDLIKLSKSSTEE